MHKLPDKMFMARWEKKYAEVPPANIVDDVVSIDIFGVIGDFFEDKMDAMVRERLTMAAGRPVEVNINSPGGVVNDAVTIFHMLERYNKERAPVTVSVLGAAYSAASLIAMAGDRIIIHEYAEMMVHNAQTYVFGNANDLEAEILQLKDTDQRMAKIYASRSGHAVGGVKEFMENETFFNAAQAVEHGFADEIYTLSVRQEAKQASLAKKILNCMQERKRADARAG